jgi:hypothetical protein
LVSSEFITRFSPGICNAFQPVKRALSYPR